MTEIPPVKKEGKFGKTFVVVSAVIGILGIAAQVYYQYNQKEEHLVAVGTHSNFEVPIRFKIALYDPNRLMSKPIRDALPSNTNKPASTDIEKKYLVVLDAIEKKESEQQNHLKEIDAIKTFREITITNQGKKEAENISLELEDSVGFYQVGDDDKSPSGTFSQSIPVGNLRPTLAVRVYVWSADDFYAWRHAFVSYKNGSETVIYPQDASDSSWTWIDYLLYSVIALAAIGVAFGIGYVVGDKEWREKLKRDQEEFKEFQELKKSKRSNIPDQPKIDGASKANPDESSKPHR